MSSDRTVSIIAPFAGRKNSIANDVPVGNLAIYSRRYSPNGAPGGKELNLGHTMNEDVARTIATHIKNADPNNPAPVTLELFGKDLCLQKLVQIYRVMGQGYRLPRERHDNTIREELRKKMYDTTPFLFADFELMVENVAFDRGLLASVMDRLAFLHIKEYLDDETKTAVENYCKSREGYWDMLLDTVGKVEAKINTAAEQKAAREKARDEREARKAKKAEEEVKHLTIKSSNGGGNGNKGNGNKGGNDKEKKPVAPFVHKEDDFPPLA